MIRVKLQNVPNPKWAIVVIRNAFGWMPLSMYRHPIHNAELIALNWHNFSETEASIVPCDDCSDAEIMEMVSCLRESETN